MFIRHGESEWNVCFNRGIGISMIWRIVVAVAKEWMLALSMDSVFIDSPLSKLGCQQAKQLLAYIETYPTSSSKSDGTARPDQTTLPDPAVSECVAILKGEHEAKTTVLWTSNLRRSIATIVIGLWGRLNRNNEGSQNSTVNSEKVILQSFLQEISNNVDTIALADPLELPNVDQMLAGQLFGQNGVAADDGVKVGGDRSSQRKKGDSTQGESTFPVSRYLDPRGNRGNKPVFGSGLTRLQV